MDDDYGAVEEGKIANLLILRENPLKDIDACVSIVYVILHGQLIERVTLAVKN